MAVADAAETDDNSSHFNTPSPKKRRSRHRHQSLSEMMRRGNSQAEYVLDDLDRFHRFIERRGLRRPAHRGGHGHLSLQTKSGFEILIPLARLHQMQATLATSLKRGLLQWSHLPTLL